MPHSTGSGAVPLPGLTKRLSEGEKKSFAQAPCLPSLHGNVGAESGSSLLVGMGKRGGFVKGMPGTKGVGGGGGGGKHL